MTFDIQIHTYSSPKPNNAVKSFKKYLDLMAKMRSFNDLMITMPSGVVVLSHNSADTDALPTENFLVWKEKDAATFFNWVMVDPKKSYVEIKEKNFKVRDMHIEIWKDRLRIKDGVGATPNEMWPGATTSDYGMVDLDRLHEEDDTKNLALATSFYKHMDKYIWSAISGTINFIPVQQELGDKLASGSHINLLLVGDEARDICNLNLMRSLFPMYKTEGIPLSYAVVDEEPEQHKAYVLFKEEHEKFDLYTLLACLTISTHGV